LNVFMNTYEIDKVINWLDYDEGTRQSVRDLLRQGNTSITGAFEEYARNHDILALRRALDPLVLPTRRSATGLPSFELRISQQSGANKSLGTN